MENIRVFENEAHKKTFDDQGSRLGLKLDTQETLKNIKKCLLEYDRDKNLSLFLKPREIGNEPS